MSDGDNIQWLFNNFLDSPQHYGSRPRRSPPREQRWLAGVSVQTDLVWLLQQKVSTAGILSREWSSAAGSSLPL